MNRAEITALLAKQPIGTFLCLPPSEDGDSGLVMVKTVEGSWQIKEDSYTPSYDSGIVSGMLVALGTTWSLS